MSKQEPVRIFKSDFLEKFTHVHLWQFLTVWLSITATLLFFGFYEMLTQTTPLTVLDWLQAFFAVPCGILFWTLSEYCIHRFIFHAHPKSAWGKKFIFIAHGIHHLQPRIATRLLMPLGVSLTLGTLFFLVVLLIPGFELFQRYFFTAAVTASYLSYDYLHWAQHNSKSKNPYLLKMRRYHMRHHVQHSDNLRFGVSQTWWDKVFQTYPNETK